MRAVMSRIAREDWQRDTSSSATDVASLPPLMGGSNCRAALLKAQMASPQLQGTIAQIRAELAGRDVSQKDDKGVAAVSMKPAERVLYRLSPADEVLERKVILANCSLWVPVAPNETVEGEDPAMSWRRWMFEFAHASALNPRRSSGESYQILRRMVP